jgi:hypothetical protein
MSWFCKRVFIVSALLAAVACGGSSNDTPTAPTGDATKETFTGGFDPNGSGSPHQFTIQKSNGLLNLILTSVTVVSTGAPAGVPLTLALGSQSTSGCVAISGAVATVPAGTTSITSGLSGTAGAGSYCLIVYDPVASGAVSALPGPIKYTVEVTHF